MQKKLLFLVPRDSMDEEQRKYYSKLYTDVLFEFSDPYDPIPQVRQKVKEGIEIVGGRGNAAVAIRQEFSNLHVVQIQVTGYDVIRSLRRIDPTGATVAVITSNVDVSGLKIFEQLYSIHIIGYLMVPFSKLENTIRDAVINGAKYILGGALICRMAKDMNIPAQVIPLALGPESMVNAIHELKQVQKAIELENARQGFLNRLLDSIKEGVISTDLTGKITMVNANASRILQMSPRMAIGKGINTFLPEDTPDGTDNMVNINGNRILFTRTSVLNGNQDDGIIYTLHEPSHIETLETSIRRETYADSNHIARFHFTDIIGLSPTILETIRIARNYAKTESNVLITGETGSGKEMFAQSIHNAGTRHKGPFVAVNCASLPETLLESELFGYVEGAFTGANRKGRAGLFEAAHGGTIFLDEISETSYSSQGRLLRVLQEKYIVRLGSQKIIPVNVRVIAATNRNLHELVEQGKFREDLYYRLNVLNLVIPPLRERDDDAIILLNHFLKTFGANVTINEDVVGFLREYPWRGNIREVGNLAERVVATLTGLNINRKQIERLLDPHDLSVSYSTHLSSTLQLREKKQKTEILNALDQAKGNMGKAADILGIDRSTLWRRMKRLDMQ